MRRRTGALTFWAAVIGAMALASQAGAVITSTNNAATIYPTMNGAGNPITSASFLNQPGPGDGVPAELPNAISTSALAGFPLTGSSNYAILTSGDAQLVDDPNDAGSTGFNFTGFGNDGNIRGDTDYDVTILSLNVNVPAVANPCLNFEFRFLSEEYPEFVGSSYNDAFIAELDATDWDTSGSDITGVENFAKDQANNPITINATGPGTVSAVNSYGTTFDSATRRLRASKSTTSGPKVLYLSIFDQGDHRYDSAVFVDNVTVTSDATCSTGQVSATDTPPPAPAVTPNVGASSATFTFGPPPPGGFFICQLHEGPADDEQKGEPFLPCTSPHVVDFNADLDTGSAQTGSANSDRLFPGPHTLSVAAVDEEGTASQTPTSFEFEVGEGSDPPANPTPPAPAQPKAKKCKKKKAKKKSASAAAKCKKKKK